MPTALKLEVLMDELDEKNEARVAELTGLNAAVVRRCKKLLSYSRDYQELMLNEDPTSRIKADFFIELHPVINDRLMKSQRWFRRSNFIDTMLDRYLRKTGQIKAVTDFRLIKQSISTARKAGKEFEIGMLLHEFYQDETKPIEHLEVVSANIHRSAAKITSDSQKLEQAVKDIDVQVFFGEKTMWDALDSLRKSIARKLNAADRRTS